MHYHNTHRSPIRFIKHHNTADEPCAYREYEIICHCVNASLSHSRWAIVTRSRLQAAYKCFYTTESSEPASYAAKPGCESQKHSLLGQKNLCIKSEEYSVFQMAFIVNLEASQQEDECGTEQATIFIDISDISYLSDFFFLKQRHLN